MRAGDAKETRALVARMAEEGDTRPCSDTLANASVLRDLTRRAKVRTSDRRGNATGDLVKAVFRSAPPSETYDAERMWVQVTSAHNDWLVGILDSDPADMPNIPKGSVVRLPRTHVIDFIFADAEKAPPPSRQPGREYWERCLVDRCVINGEAKVGYLYREEPGMAKDGDRFPDSGWRIRGDIRGKSTEELASGGIAYVAVGVVLNKDDTWLHLIDEPIGAGFEKDFERGVFISST